MNNLTPVIPKVNEDWAQLILIKSRLLVFLLIYPKDTKCPPSPSLDLGRGLTLTFYTVSSFLGRPVLLSFRAQK